MRFVFAMAKCARPEWQSAPAQVPGPVPTHDGGGAAVVEAVAALARDDKFDQAAYLVGPRMDSDLCGDPRSVIGRPGGRPGLSGRTTAHHTSL